MLCVALMAAAQTDSTPDVELLQKFRVECEAHSGGLWPAPVCGRMMLVDGNTRTAVATHPDSKNVLQPHGKFFKGALPADVMVANTSVRWDGSDWAMVLLPLPDDPFRRTRLLAHECFHRAQTELGLNAMDAVSSHLDSKDGRSWLRLELRALAAALRSTGEASRTAARDALLFRAMRRSFARDAARNESALEMQEGVAEYTGTVIALRSTGETVHRVSREIEAFEDRPALARSFAYATGPALGLLLDRHGPADWRKKLSKTSSLSDMLAVPVGYQVTADLAANARKRGAAYGSRAVFAAEEERAERHEKTLASFRERFLKGPVLRFPKSTDLRRVFNPSNLVSLGEEGTVYPTGTFTAAWGKLQIDDTGGLLGRDNQTLRVAAPSVLTSESGRPVNGPGWKLELSPGWTVAPVLGTKDFQVVAGSK